MQQQPKQTKYRKQQRGRNKGMVYDQKVAFGKYAMRAMTRGRLGWKQLESGRREIMRSLKRVGKLWIRVFPDHPVTKKALGVRMGKGKGPVESWETMVKPGMLLYELRDDVDEETARKAFMRAASKLSVKISFVKRTLL